MNKNSYLNKEYQKSLNEKDMVKKLESKEKQNELFKIVENAENYKKFNEKLKQNELMTRNQLANDYELSIRDRLKKNKMERIDDLVYGNNLIQNAHLSLQYEKNLKNQKLMAYRKAFQEGKNKIYLL
jgi:hypothetical protein